MADVLAVRNEYRLQNWMEMFKCKSKFQCLALRREISLANASPALTYAKLDAGY